MSEATFQHLPYFAEHLRKEQPWRTCVTSQNSGKEKTSRSTTLRPTTPQMISPSLTPIYDPLAHKAQQQAAYSRSLKNPALHLLQELPIGLYDHALADLEHFRNTVTRSAGFFRGWLYRPIVPPRPAAPLRVAGDSSPHDRRYASWRWGHLLPFSNKINVIQLLQNSSKSVSTTPPRSI